MSLTDRRWTAGQPNLLSPEIVAKVRFALDDGILCGLHAFYCAGCGPEPCAYADLPSYLHDVEQSRPGDWFTLWSVPMLAKENRLLIWKRKALVSEGELQDVSEWLNEDPWHEFVVVGRATLDAKPEAAWGDYDCFERIQDFAQKFASTGEFALLPLANLMEPNDEHRWIPRCHVVDAKRPNERGEVPLRGAY